VASNLNDTTPAAPAGGLNVKWQTDGAGNDSAYVPFSGLPVAVIAFAPGVGTNNQILARFKVSYGIKFPSGASASQASASANATADTTYTFKKNGSSFATVKFDAGATTFTYTQASDSTFTAGDLFEIDGPATADATLADVGITFQGTRT
jgi:uncharacterized protein YkuJ